MLAIEAPKVINKAKTGSWKRLLPYAVMNSDGPNMWKVIQGLNGTPDANSPNEAMPCKGWTIANIRPKANIFINQYVWVNKLNMSWTDRDLNQQFSKCLNAPSVDDESCTPLQMHELLSGIKKWKVKEQLAPIPSQIS